MGTLRRSNSGDLGRLDSPPGTPPAPFRTPHNLGDLHFGLADDDDDPPALARSVTPPPPPQGGYSPFRSLTPPGSLPQRPALSAPKNLLAPTFDRSSLPSEFLCRITHEVMT